MLDADVAMRNRFFSISFFLLVSALVAPASLVADEALCSLPRIADEGVDRFVAGECFVVDLPSAGLFTLAVETLSSLGEEPVLTYLGSASCNGTDFAEETRLLNRTVASLAFEAPGPGVHGFCLGAEAGADLRVVRRFAPAFGGSQGAEKDDDPDESEPDPKPLMGCGAGDWTKDDDPDESEPDPKPLMGCGAGDWTKDDDPDESEPDPKPLVGCGAGDWTKDDDPDESEPDPKPFSGCGGLCTARSWGDDHADLATCASSLGVVKEACGGRRLEAELQSQAGWDHDFFVFEIESLSRVEILGRSNVRLELVLFGAAGQRLGVAEAAEVRGATSFEKALPRGTYYLRVAAADGEEGSYSLQIEASAVDP